MNVNGRKALLVDLGEAQGLLGLAEHLGPEVGPPDRHDAAELDPAQALGSALETLPDEGDRLVRALAGQGGELFGRKLPFCGRREALEALYNAVRDAVGQRRLHIVEIAGARGLGKTRVLAEALAIIDANARGIDVLPVAVRPGDGPQALIAQLVRRRFGIHPRDSDQAAYDRILEALEPFVDERLLVGQARLLGHLAGLRAMGPGADALPADLEAFRRQAQRALIGVFRHDLVHAPRILVLQGPQALDQHGLEVLLGLVSELAGEPFILAVLGDLPAHSELRVVQDGRAARVRVTVEPLGERDMERFAAALFASPGEFPELVRTLVDTARGSPRLALENARLLVQRGLLSPSADGLVLTGVAGTVDAKTLATDLEEASRLRVLALGRGEKALLQAAAVLGRAFSAEAAFAVGQALDPALGEALGGEPGLLDSESVWPAVERVLETLRVAGLLRRDPAFVNDAHAEVTSSAGADSSTLGAVWRFAHGDDRARLLGELGGDLRPNMHALAAQWLEGRQVAGHDPGVFYEAVAAHWLHAGRRSEAARALVRAAEAARDGLALHRARSLYRAALDALGLHGPTRGLDRAPLLLTTLLGYADFAARSGEVQLCRRLSAAALEAAHATDPRPANELGSVARAWLLLGRAYRGLGSYAFAKTCLHQAADLSRRAADARGSGDALGELARVHWLEGGDGGYTVALRLLEEALEVRRALGSARAIAETLGLIANIRIQRADFDGARPVLEEARSLSREVYDLAGEARALMALGAIAYFRDELERAIELWQEGLRVAEMAGERELIGAFLNNIGEARLARGELDHARAALLEAREVTMETGDLRTLTDALKNLSGLYTKTGELVRAQAAADEAHALATAMGARPALAAALLARGEVRSQRATVEGDPSLVAAAAEDLVSAGRLFAELGAETELARAQAAQAAHQDRHRMA